MQRLAAIALATLLAASAACGETVSDAQRGYTFQAPSGFRTTTEVNDPRLSHVFVHDGPAPGRPAFAISLQPLGGTLGRERLTPEMLPKNSNVTLFRIEWKGFMVDGFDRRQTVNGTPLVSFAVQVPLVPEAIQVNVTGPADREAEVRGYLKSALAGLDGRTNWIGSVASPEVEDSPLYLWVLLGIGLVIAVPGAVLLWWLAKKEGGGTASAVSVCLIGVGWGFGFLPFREAKLLCVVLELLGVLGIVFGIVAAIVRRRKLQEAAKARVPGQPPP